MHFNNAYKSEKEFSWKKNESRRILSGATT